MHFKVPVIYMDLTCSEYTRKNMYLQTGNTYKRESMVSNLSAYLGKSFLNQNAQPWTFPLLTFPFLHFFFISFLEYAVLFCLQGFELTFVLGIGVNVLAAEEFRAGGLCDGNSGFVLCWIVSQLQSTYHRAQLNPSAEMVVPVRTHT